MSPSRLYFLLSWLILALSAVTGHIEWALVAVGFYLGGFMLAGAGR